MPNLTPEQLDELESEVKRYGKAAWVFVFDAFPHLLAMARECLAARSREARLREALEIVAAPYVIDGKDHAAAVKHARAALSERGEG